MTLRELDGDVGRLSGYCDIPVLDGDVSFQLTEYPELAEVDAQFWQHVAFAIIVAVFVQRGSTGPPFVIAFL